MSVEEGQPPRLPVDAVCVACNRSPCACDAEGWCICAKCKQEILKDDAYTPKGSNNYCSACVSVEPESGAQDSCSVCGRDLLNLSKVELDGKTFCLVCKPIGDALSEAVELIKHDANKPRYDLIPPDALDAIAQVLTEGAAKYSPRGWESGERWGKCFSSCMRHLWAWWRGERLDPESALPHLAHAACRVMFLLAYEIREVGEDDRA